MNRSDPESVTLMTENLIADKSTTQKAPLERLLTHLRTRKILPFTLGARVLDFGCGAYLHTLRAIGNRASFRYGLDALFKNKPFHKTADGIGVAGSFADLADMLRQDGGRVNCIVSLACFEHFESNDFRMVLGELDKISTEDAILVGTVPTPPAKPVLEFLSYKLGLIDPSQIEDHKVYYDRQLLTDTLKGTNWELADYKTFQFGMNSFFKLKKSVRSYS